MRVNDKKTGRHHESENDGEDCKDNRNGRRESCPANEARRVYVHDAKIAEYHKTLLLSSFFHKFSGSTFEIAELL